LFFFSFLEPRKQAEREKEKQRNFLFRRQPIRFDCICAPSAESGQKTARFRQLSLGTTQIALILTPNHGFCILSRLKTLFQPAQI
jgi:hypothetical protein